MNLIIYFSLILVLLFFFSNDLVTCLLCLFFYTLFYSFVCYLKTLEFWGLSLLMIVMITGLFLVFAYIVSINPQSPFSIKGNVLLYYSLLMLFLLFKNYKLDVSMIILNFSCLCEISKELYKSSLFISSFLIFLLLLLVIFFIRLTYNKGGSLRKKF
uniref:NADH dehydrogenase subunit 6 n=1 Tax=Osborniella crotophagae TaxID=1912107 RepID=A0A7T1HEZ0_9NEOP|nr:NADH dehydrogenase subunit 6 [Osborniella crotophagae]